MKSVEKVRKALLVFDRTLASDFLNFVMVIIKYFPVAPEFIQYWQWSW